MKPKLLIGAVALLAMGVFAVAFLERPTSKPDTSTTRDTPSGYTMAEVTKHNSASSCWAAINGKVYDLTKWISQHPGGQTPILSLCGTDGSAAFNGQHGGQARPASELAQFLLGPLSR